jgi:hypothetical protein
MRRNELNLYRIERQECQMSKHLRYSRFGLMFICLSMILTGSVGCRFFGSQPEPSQPAMVEHQVHKPTNVLVSRHFSRFKPRRIVIVSPTSHSSVLPEQQEFSRALADSLSRAGFSHAVIAYPRKCDFDSVHRGKINMQQLVDLSNEYSADSILYSNITSFSPYSPLHASASLTLVDASESVVLMAIDGNWDLRRPEVRDSYQNFLASQGGYRDFEASTRYQSPTEFLRFITDDLAEFIGSQ